MTRGRQILVSNPQLAYALLQAQVILGMVKADQLQAVLAQHAAQQQQQQQQQPAPPPPPLQAQAPPLLQQQPLQATMPAAQQPTAYDMASATTSATAYGSVRRALAGRWPRVHCGARHRRLRWRAAGLRGTRGAVDGNVRRRLRRAASRSTWRKSAACAASNVATGADATVGAACDGGGGGGAACCAA